MTRLVLCIVGVAAVFVAAQISGVGGGGTKGGSHASRDIASVQGMTAQTPGDNRWWGSLQHTEKLHVVEGMLDAFDEGYRFGSSEALIWVSQYEHRNKTWAANSIHLVRYLRFSKSTEMYVSEINNFYSKYPDDASNVSVGQILGCLADSPILSCAEVAAAAHGD